MDEFRWTGREGEKVFSLLCSRRMVTCNKAEEDDRGWDFIVSFPPRPIIAVPIDQRSVGPTALVQIKATRVDAKRWSISLKNALSLAHSPLPAFIICVGLDSVGGEQFRAVHIWGEEIGRILKAARQAHVDGDEAIHRRSVSFEFGEGTVRADILEWIESEIERVGENVYAAAKQLLVDTLGFEEGRGVARVRLSTSSPDALLDLQLGILKSVDLEHFSFTPSRFGIVSSTPTIEVEGGSLEIIPIGKHGTLRLRSPHGRQELLPAEVISAVLPGSRRTKGRIKTDCIDVILRSRRRMSVTATLGYDQITSLESIGAFALLKQSTPASPLMMSLRVADRFEEMGHVNMSGKEGSGWQQLMFITQGLRRIVAFEGASPLLTSVSVINSRFVPLSVLEALVTDRPLRVEFTPVKDVEGTVGAHLSYAVVELDGCAIGAVASRPLVSDAMVGKRRHLHFGPATILHAAVGGADVSEMRELYLDELDRMSEAVDVFATGDLQDCVNHDEDRILMIDEPRRTPPRRLAAT